MRGIWVWARLFGLRRAVSIYGKLDVRSRVELTRAPQPVCDPRHSGNAADEDPGTLRALRSHTPILAPGTAATTGPDAILPR